MKWQFKTEVYWIPQHWHSVLLTKEHCQETKVTCATEIHITFHNLTTTLGLGDTMTPTGLEMDLAFLCWNKRSSVGIQTYFWDHLFTRNLNKTTFPNLDAVLYLPLTLQTGFRQLSLRFLWSEHRFSIVFLVLFSATCLESHEQTEVKFLVNCANVLRSSVLC